MDFSRFRFPLFRRPWFSYDPNLKFNDKTDSRTVHMSHLFCWQVVCGPIFCWHGFVWFIKLYQAIKNWQVAQQTNRNHHLQSLVYPLYDTFIIIVFSHWIYCNRLSSSRITIYNLHLLAGYAQSRDCIVHGTFLWDWDCSVEQWSWSRSE